MLKSIVSKTTTFNPMIGGGFARHMIEVFKANRALKTSSRKNKLKAGKGVNGKKPLRFGKATSAQKKTVLFNKNKIQKQIRFRVGLLILTIIFTVLIISLFISLG
jgi:hypothetical protein